MKKTFTKILELPLLVDVKILFLFGQAAGIIRGRFQPDTESNFIFIKFIYLSSKTSLHLNYKRKEFE